MLWRVGSAGHDEGLVGAIDFVSRMWCYLVFKSKEIAMSSAKAHKERYNIEFHPVRICTIRGDDLS